jgi:hypothetical protein
MTTRSIARMFDSYEHAQAAIRDLEAAGFSSDDVSYMGNRTGGTLEEGTEARTGETGADTGAATGATLGTVLGGGAGLLAGIGALAIPGIGPVVAAGWLVAALTGAGVGAAAGGLLGALTGAGLGEEHATTYAEGVRRGGHLVVVRAAETRTTDAERILDRHNPVDMESRTTEWRNEGWTGGNAAGMGGAGTGLSGTTAGTSTASGTLGTGMRDDVTPVNDPTRRRPGDVA